MAIPGKGCFIAWFDLRPGSDVDHDIWHTHEHMIERVAIPGFRRGLRYRSLGGSPRVCVIYHVESVETLGSPAYLERLNNPTPWTTRSMPLLVGMNRTLCDVVLSCGHGMGGYLLTIQLEPHSGEEDRLKGWLCGDALPALAARAGLCGAHFLIANRAVSQIRTNEKELRREPDAVADWVLLVEGYDRGAIDHALIELGGAGGLVEHGTVERPTSGLYSLDFMLDESEAKKIWQKPTA